MVKLSVNLDEVELNDFEIIPAGKYLARVSDIVEKESQSGNPMLVWNWDIVGGEHAGVGLKSYTSLQDHALFGLKQHLEAFSIVGDVSDFEMDALIGKTAKITVTKNVIVNRDSNEDMDVNRVTKVYATTSTASGAAAPTAVPAAVPVAAIPAAAPAEASPPATSAPTTGSKALSSEEIPL